jgi:hypothetical protein
MLRSRTVRPLFLGSACAALVALTACATNPVRARTAALAAADGNARAALAGESALDVAKIPARSFAVLPFRSTARDTILAPLRFGLPALLIGDLSVSPSLRLVERLETDAILRELALVDSGIVDPRTAPRVGRLVGARRLLLGEVSRPTDNTIRLTARVVDVVAGTVEELVTADAPLVRVLDAEKALALLIFEKLGITLTASQRTRVEQRQSTQLAAIVAYGKGVDAEAHGDAPRAVASYRDAVRLDTRFAAAIRASLPVAAMRTAGAGAGIGTGIGIERIVGISSAAINAPFVTRLPDTADAPLSAGTMISLTFLIRVTP